MKIKPVERTGGVVVELGRNEAQLPSAAGEGANPVQPALTLRKILVPVDFSECTGKALQYAVAFASQFGAELTLLHVQEPSYVPASEMGIMPDIDTSEEIGKQLQELRDRIGREIRCQTVLRKGSAKHEIIETAKQLGSDLIILSTHGRSGLERILLGSTAERVVRHAGCPMLVVRENEHEFLSDSQFKVKENHEFAEAKIEAEMTAGI